RKSHPPQSLFLRKGEAKTIPFQGKGRCSSPFGTKGDRGGWLFIASGDHIPPVRLAMPGAPTPFRRKGVTHYRLRPRPPLDFAAALISAVVGGAGTSPGFMGFTLLPCFRRNCPAVTTSSPALRPCVTMMPASPASPPVTTGCMVTYLAGLLPDGLASAGALLAARLPRRPFALLAGAELSAAFSGRLSVTSHT